MKLKYTLEIVDMGGELIAVPIGENAHQLQGVVKLNNEGREIIELLQTETTEEEIVYNLAKTYENSKDDLSFKVHKYICLLQSYGLLDS